MAAARGWLSGAVLVLLPLAAAFVVDRAYGVEVTLLARTRTAEEREAWRASGWDPRDGVAELYGIVEPPTGLRVIVLDPDRIVRPPEDPSLALLPVDRAAGEDALSARALWWRAGWSSLGVGLVVLVLRLLVAAAVRLWRGAGAVGGRRDEHA